MNSAQRIISLVPSLTELLFDLGLDDEVVGRTKFCIHPADKVKDVAVIGGTKQVHLDRVASLSPTLIVANKEENTRADIESLQAAYPVLLTDVVTIEDALHMIATVGDYTNRPQEAQQLVRDIQASFALLPPGPIPHRVAYLIWRKPWMVAGGETFINSMLAVAGFANAFAHQPRYPAVTANELQAAKPDVIFLSSEPYPFNEKHVDELGQVCPEALVMLVDGELFSWYGSRILRSAAYFGRLRQAVTR